MKTTAKVTEVTTHGVGETKQATIKASAKLFSFFSDQIYADKFTAIWRELVANGVDAQKVVGNETRPIVTLPSTLDPVAKVRDFGTGMGHEFMMNKFMAFTDASTKENSNDFIGGFGIGSKAPLSYTEQYSITNFRGGVKRIYSVFKDETGCPAIAFLSETKTDEPDGVEVSFPVRQDDIRKFNDVVCKTLQYFDPLPRLENTQLELNPVEYDGQGEGWGIKLGRGDCRVIIGGVAYPLDLSKMSYDQREKYKTLHEYGSFGIDIYMPIGEATIALSREHVTHDEELFSKLDKIIRSAVTSLGEELAKMFEAAPTLWEAKKMLADAVDGVSYHDQKAKLIRKYAKYQGDKLEVSVLRPDAELYPVEAIFHGSFGYFEKRNLNATEAMAPRYRSWDPTAKFSPNLIKHIVLDDGPEKSLLRVRAVIEEKSGNILFIRPRDKGPFDWNGFLNELGNPDFELLSDYEPKKVVRQPSNTPARPFKAYVGNRKPHHGSNDYQSSLPTDGGVYVRMDNFAPIPTHNPGRKIEVAKLLGKTMVWLNITDFKNSDVEASPDWISVDEAVKLVKADYRAKNKRLAWAEAWYRWTHESRGNAFDDDIEHWSKYEGFPKQGPLFQLNRLRLEFADVNTPADSTMRRNLLEVKSDDQLTKIEKLAEAARQKHPLVFELDAAVRYRSVSEEIWNKMF